MPSCEKATLWGVTDENIEGERIKNKMEDMRRTENGLLGAVLCRSGTPLKAAVALPHVNEEEVTTQCTLQS